MNCIFDTIKRMAILKQLKILRRSTVPLFAVIKYRIGREVS